MKILDLEIVYLGEISSTRKEIRLRYDGSNQFPSTLVDNVSLTNFLNENEESTIK